MSWGTLATVVKPKVLAERVRKTAEQLVNRYQRVMDKGWSRSIRCMICLSSIWLKLERPSKRLYDEGMKLTAVFEPAVEGGFTCFVEEIPAAISQGETLAEAKANLLDALKLVLECQRELAEKDLSPGAVRETFEFVGG